MRRVVVPLLGLAALLLVSGCPSVSVMTTAKTIGAGKNEIAFSPSVYGIAASTVGGSSSGSVNTGLFWGGAIDLMYRHGFGDHFDLGGSLSGFGELIVDGKINFIDTPVIALSVDPGIGGVFFGAASVGAGYVQFNVPLLFDIAFGESVRLTLAPKYSGLWAFAAASSSAGSGSVSAYSHLLGGAAGLEIKAGKVFRIMPHGGFLTRANNPSGYSGVLVSGGVAFKFVF